MSISFATIFKVYFKITLKKLDKCLSIKTALRIAKKLERYDIYWLEEPILADEIDNLARLANETSIP